MRSQTSRCEVGAGTFGRTMAISRASVGAVFCGLTIWGHKM